MLVFLSWSGERSKAAAIELAKWLRMLNPAIEPWLSTDIEKGTKWEPEVAKRLESSKIGIFCLTKENLNSKWMLFEAGALSVKGAHVYTLLLDVKPSDIEPPLTQFQHTSIEKNDICKLLSSINREVEKTGEKALDEINLVAAYESNWSLLEMPLKEIIATEYSPSLYKSQMPKTFDEMEVFCRYDDCSERIVEPDGRITFRKAKYYFRHY